jgi:hypothetical protein
MDDFSSPRVPDAHPATAEIARISVQIALRNHKVDRQNGIHAEAEIVIPAPLQDVRHGRLVTEDGPPRVAIGLNWVL